jgi:Heat shock protein
MMQGGFTLTGDQITIGPLAMTRMACLDGLGIVQQRFVGALEKAAKASREGLTLSLYDSDDRKILELQKASSDE